MKRGMLSVLVLLGPAMLIQSSLITDRAQASGISCLGLTAGWNSPACGGPTPPLRLGASMAYDPVSQRVVMFGGCRELVTTYTTVNGTSTPVYPMSFCGATATATRSDLWIWNGANGQWAEIPRPDGVEWPHARWNASLAYDAVSGKLLLFGGLYMTKNNEGAPASTDAESCFYYDISSVQAGSDSVQVYCFKDTWLLQGGTWTWEKWTPGSNPVPPSRFSASMASFRDQTPTLAGGCRRLGLVQPHSASHGLNWDCKSYVESSYWDERVDTWTWNGSMWIERCVGSQYSCVDLNTMQVEMPDERMAAPMLYNPGSSATFDDTIQLWGGYYYSYDVNYGSWERDYWYWSGSRWDVQYNKNTFDTWCSSPLPRSVTNSAAAAFPTAARWKALFFGGTGRNQLDLACRADDDGYASRKTVDATWHWDDPNAQGSINLVECQTKVGTDHRLCWEPGYPATSLPPRRQSAAMAYDPVSGRVLMFGGTCCNDAGQTYPIFATTYSDTWVYKPGA